MTSMLHPPVCCIPPCTTNSPPCFDCGCCFVSWCCLTAGPAGAACNKTACSVFNTALGAGELGNACCVDASSHNTPPAPPSCIQPATRMSLQIFGRSLSNDIHSAARPVSTIKSSSCTVASIARNTSVVQCERAARRPSSGPATSAAHQAPVPWGAGAAGLPAPSAACSVDREGPNKSQASASASFQQQVHATRSTCPNMRGFRPHPLPQRACHSDCRHGHPPPNTTPPRPATGSAPSAALGPACALPGTRRRGRLPAASTGLAGPT